MSKDREATVVVVGGGYGGVNVAKALDASLGVVLVEPKDAFMHNVASLRALVEPEFLPRIFIPYDNLLAHGRVVHDRAVEVHPDRVVVASGDTIAADYVVLASGSSYPFPAKTAEHTTAEAIDQYRAAHDELMRADRVLLIGAGAVGIELAGEIVAKWPDKKVTLLDLADDVLGPRFRSDLRAELRHQLVELGVDVVLGEGLESLPPTAATELATFTVTTETGRAITADIWFQCFGVTPVSDYLRGDLAAARRDDGFVDIGPTLQLPGQTTVFAIGDMSAADAKMAGLASRQAQVVAANITKLAAGDDHLDEYASIGTAIIVPIGPENGSGQLPGQEELASREMVSNAKGRDLMVDRFLQIMGADTTVSS